jgi:hypothetical protein
MVCERRLAKPMETENQPRTRREKGRVKVPVESLFDSDRASSTAHPDSGS